MLATFLFSCGENDKTKNREFENCLKDEIVKDNGIKNCDLFPLDSSKFCDIVHPDTILRLTEYQKGWLPYFCCNLGEEIYYVDKDENETSFVILNKEFFINKVLKSSQDTCPDNNLRKIYYCFDFEDASVNVYSDLLNIEFHIVLEPDFSSITAKINKSWAVLNINSYVKIDSNYKIKTHLFTLLGNDYNDKPYIGFSKHFDEINILGRTFYDVYNYENPRDEDYREIYYNSDYGIVSFIDKSGKQWRIKTD